MTRQLHRMLSRTLVTLAAAGCTLASHAVPVSVSIGGLPSGLAPVLTVQRNVCTDGESWLNNPSQQLTEQNLTTLERVVLPSGLVTFRSRIVTRYVASFDTPATPDPAGPGPQVRCSVAGINHDLFRFGIRVPGLNAAGRPAVVSGFVADVRQAAPVSVNQTLSAQTTSFLPALTTLARGMTHVVETNHAASLGTVEHQQIDFLRPSPLFPGAYQRVARLFMRDATTGCVQAGTTTRCLGDGPDLPEAGGVLLRGASTQLPGRRGVVQFRFELMHGFPIGSLSLSARADARDLDAYIVDGTPQPLDLLPWQGMSQSVTVQ
jgi:hypothetical protein